LAPFTILYVEDSEDLRVTIGMLLEGPGRDVTSCAAGEEALELMAKQEYDLLITDVSLPGISGTDLARKVLTTQPDKWIILCSGYEFGSAVSQFGPNVRAILKPFEPDDLDALINDIASLRQPRAA
jgi:two-component system cell cycle response regulator CpdR